VVGLKPEKKKHQFFIDIVPEFGFPLAIRSAAGVAGETKVLRFVCLLAIRSTTYLFVRATR
jgi:hypothetical protein